jgi:hypothetical protein
MTKSRVVRVVTMANRAAVRAQAPNQVPLQPVAALLPSRPQLRKQENKHAAAIPQKVS